MNTNDQIKARTDEVRAATVKACRDLVQTLNRIAVDLNADDLAARSVGTDRGRGYGGYLARDAAGIERGLATLYALLPLLAEGDR